MVKLRFHLIHLILNGFFVGNICAQNTTSDNPVVYYIQSKPVLLDQGWIQQKGIQDSLIFDHSAPSSLVPQKKSPKFSLLRKTVKTKPGRSIASENENIVLIQPSAQKQPHRFSQLEANLQNYYSRIDTDDTVNGANGSIVSKLNYATQVSWIQNWNYVLKRFIRFRLARESYETDTSRPETSFVERNKTLSSFSLGIRRQIGKFYHQEELSFSQELYLKGLKDLSGVELVTGVIPRLNLNGGYFLVNLWPYVIYSEAGLIVNGPGVAAGFQSKWNYGGQLKLGLMQQWKSQSGLKAEAFYTSQNLNSSLSHSKRQDLGLLLSYGFNFGIED